jgi:protein-S-isoprenylcysteine O-methyltransferase Ste14
MRPLPFVWPVCVPFWLVYCWAFAPEIRLMRRARRSAAENARQDAGSLKVIAWGQGVALLAASAVALTTTWGAMAASKWPAYVAGTTLLVGGGLLRRHCFRMLGAAFTGAVHVEPGHQVVEHGAYRWVRHPSYTAGLMMFAGIGLALGNWASVALMTLLPALAYAYRVRAEERALVATIGAPYESYMSRTRRFIPFVF